MITNGHGEGWRSSPVVELGVCPHLEKGKPDVGRGGMFPSEEGSDVDGEGMSSSEKSSDTGRECMSPSEKRSDAGGEGMSSCE